MATELLNAILRDVYAKNLYSNGSGVFGSLLVQNNANTQYALRVRSIGGNTYTFSLNEPDQWVFYTTGAGYFETLETVSVLGSAPDVGIEREWNLGTDGGVIFNTDHGFLVRPNNQTTPNPYVTVGTGILGVSNLMPTSTENANYEFYCGGATFGGVSNNHFQLFGYYQAGAYPSLIQEFINCRPSSDVVSNGFLGFNLDFPIDGGRASWENPGLAVPTETITDSAVVACASISNNSRVAFYYSHGNPPVVQPQYVINPGVGFTFTCTVGAQYHWVVFG